MELVVALLLTAIVVTFAYTALLQWTGIFRTWSRTTASLDDSVLLMNALRSDNQRSTSLHHEENMLVFKAAQGNTCYLSHDSVIVRIHHAQPADSFHFTLDSLRCTFMGRPSQDNGELVDNAVFFCHQEDRKISFRTEKHYDTKTLLRLHENDIEKP